MGKVSSDVQKWLDNFSVYEREFKKWEETNKKILKRYRDDGRSKRTNNSRFNILWSNVQTLVPAVFARMPRPEVSRRFHDPDPVGRIASLLLERGLDYEVMHYPDFKATMRQCVYDRFLGGRGSAWVRYEPHMRAAKLQLPSDGDQVSEDEDEPEEELDYECVPVDYVHWKDFGHTVARTWEEVSAVWRCVYLTKEAVAERFGDAIAKKIPMDAKREDMKLEQYGSSGEDFSRARIYEIWDKVTKKAIWLSKGVKEILDEKDDPLGLEEFFPCPRSLYSTLTNESLIPVPDFTLYEDQANELDVLCGTIDGLAKSLKVRGVYDGSIKELSRLFTEGNNTDLIPVKNWAAFAEKNGLKGAIDLVDLDPIARALKESYAAFDQAKQQVYEITGISDIIRGETNAQETATAQQIKGQYASLRLKNMQSDVAQFASELIQLKAQVICNKFAPQTLIQISAADQLSPEDKQLIVPAMALLFGERLQDPESTAPNPMRSFRVEVASDSMIQIDEREEKESRNEFLTATAGFLKNMEPIMVSMPPLAPLMMELLKFTVQGYKAGRVIEGKFEQAAQELTKQAQQPKPPPVELQQEKMKQDGETQRTQMKIQAEGGPQAKMMEAQGKLQIKGQEMQMKGQQKQQEMQQSSQQHAQEMQFKHAEHQMDLQHQQQKGLMDAQAQQQENAIAAQSAEQKMAFDAAAAAQRLKQQAQPKRPN